MVLILRPEDTRGLITMAEAVEATEVAFRDWGAHPSVNAPRRRVHVPSGVRVSVHQGGTPTLGMTGLFTHCELVHPMAEEQVYDAIADPAYVLFDGQTGALACVILGELTPAEMPDTLVMTGLRTATTSAVGTRLLARADARSVGLFGAGSQSRYHLLALQALWPLAQVKVYRRDAAERRRFAEEMTDVLHTEVVPVDRPEDVVRGMDVVLAATNASVPVFDGDWLEPGQHVTSIVGSNVGLVQGGFTPRKRREIDDTTLRRMDVIVAASRAQVFQDQQGDLYDPIQQGVIRDEQLLELSDVLTGRVPGRTRPDQLTLYKNNAGQGVADVAIAARVYARARERRLGSDLPLGLWASGSQHHPGGRYGGNLPGRDA
jgi:ornithine cyclodeaminase/alanine dehydrogenase-like protein (mu-crystallin family)